MLLEEHTMSRLYGYSHYAIARYEAEKHARAQAQRLLDKEAAPAATTTRAATNEEDTRKGLLLMIAAMVLPVVATATVIVLAGQ